ncbi:unnamed protein product [Rotaria sp. Silwood2]|nr:unnamed protein product [Rotaria sp. Silwood2]CAF4149884.1 unnamed protein product [Rotaria sp. Silwood2]
MEFDSKDLNTILINLFREHLMQDDNDNNDNNDNNVCKTEPMEISSFTEQQTSTTAATTYIADLQRQQYCFVIFNNPKWSYILNSKSANIPKQNNQQQQQQQRLQPTINRHAPSIVKTEKEDMSLDDQFIAQLRKLIKDYIQHTTRPLPLKYFLDLTEE